MTLPEDSFRERVQLGAAWLDDFRPGWYREVDLATLRLSSCQDCVLGQLAGGFNKVVDRWQAPGVWMSPSKASKRGFDIDPYLLVSENKWAGDEDAEFEALTVEWREVIEKRRANDAIGV